MRGIEAIWFDLDDTLYDHTYSVCRGLDQMRRRYAALAGRSSEELAVLYNRALNAVYGSYLCGEIDFREMRLRKLKLFYEAAEVNANELPEMDEFHLIYDEAYGRHRRATPGIFEVLHRLREKGMPLAVLTNGKQASQEEKLRTIGLEWMVPNLLTSEEARAPKPDPRIYEWALERTGQASDSVVMVGDSLSNDVEAAMRCGLNAMLYAPGANEPAVSTAYGRAPVIKDWNSLLDIIDHGQAPNEGMFYRK
jgi:putative hydrolase of the HAD superfamily